MKLKCCYLTIFYQQVKKSATLHSFALKHMGNPYLFLSKEKELRFSRLSSCFIVNCSLL